MAIRWDLPVDRPPICFDFSTSFRILSISLDPEVEASSMFSFLYPARRF